ncbi:MAG: hypothetical protein ABSB88_23120 [Bryobacteraceae bacterium]|jgi:hypothetical protein
MKIRLHVQVAGYRMHLGVVLGFLALLLGAFLFGASLPGNRQSARALLPLATVNGMPVKVDTAAAGSTPTADTTPVTTPAAAATAPAAPEPAPAAPRSVAPAPVPPMPQQAALQSNRPVQAAQAGTPAGFYRMKKAAVMDEHGFARPVPAWTLLIPTDWQLQGGAQWGEFSGCTTSRVVTTFKAGSADGKFGLEWYPPYYWQWSDDPGTQRNMQTGNQQKAQVRGKPCDVMPPMSAADYLRRYAVPKLRPGKQIVSIDQFPEAMQEVQQTARETEASWARTTTPVQVRADVAGARLQYVLNGQPVEEWITVIVNVTARVWPTYNVNGGQGKAMHYDCSAYSLFAMRAPRGELTGRRNFFRMILKTMKVDPNWDAQVTGVATNIAKIQQKGIADRSAIVAKNSDDINKIIKEGYEGREKMKDAAAANYSQAQRDVETFRNPTTGETMELSNLYGHAWVNDKGEYLLADHAGFDPNAVFKDAKWTALEQVKK